MFRNRIFHSGSGRPIRAAGHSSGGTASVPQQRYLVSRSLVFIVKQSARWLSRLSTLPYGLVTRSWAKLFIQR